MEYSLIQRWKIAIRPKTLPAALSPVIMGTAIAVHEGEFVFLPMIAALLVALLLQILSNLVNDLFDYLKGADTDERLGPTRVTQKGIISKKEMIVGISVIVGLSLLIGTYLVYRGGLPVMLLGLFAILSAFAYTAGPYPLGYYGFGDLFVFIFFGLVATIGTYYVQSVEVNMASILSATGVGFLIVNILVVNNLRDLDTDKQTGKKTLAVRLGKRATRIQYILLGILAYIVLLPLLLLGFPLLAVILPLLSVPWFAELIKSIFQLTGRELNHTLAKTGQLALLYSVLFMCGVLLSAVLTKI